MTLQQMVQAIVTVLAVINPVLCGEIFLVSTPKLESRQRRRAAINVSLSILIILLGSALIGLKVLKIFGISLDAFRIVGGVIIAYMGLDMLRGGHRLGQAPPRSEGDTDTRGSLAPLVMFAAGPGTIATVVTLAAVHSRHGLRLTALTASVVGAMVTFGVLLLVIEVGSRISTSTQAAITRFMGLIVTSMGMQFALAGLKAFMQG